MEYLRSYGVVKQIQMVSSVSILLLQWNTYEVGNAPSIHLNKPVSILLLQWNTYEGIQGGEALCLIAEFQSFFYNGIPTKRKPNGKKRMNIPVSILLLQWNTYEAIFEDDFKATPQ